MIERIWGLVDHLVENGGFHREKIVIEQVEDDTQPLNRLVDGGVILWRSLAKYRVEIEDLSKARYLDLKIMVSKWFLENRKDQDEISLEADMIDQTVALVAIDATLLEEAFLPVDPNGKIELDGVKYGEPTTPPDEGGY